MIRKRLPFLAVVAMLAWHCPAHAGSIPIINAGFEAQVTSSYTNDVDPPGWILSGSGGGVWNINADPIGFWSVHAPQGNQVGWLSPAGAGPATFSQVLSSVLQTDTTYTLTGEVGHPIGYEATYTVSLLAGTNILASISGTGPQGSFASFTLSFDSLGSSYVGQSLEIELSSSKAQTAFDAIALTGQSVPEPSGTFLLACGLLGLLSGSRKYSHRSTARA